jgi:hypothetical protein
MTESPGDVQDHWVPAQTIVDRLHECPNVDVVAAAHDAILRALEAEQKAMEGVIARGSALLASCGVSLSILFAVANSAAFQPGLASMTLYLLSLALVFGAAVLSLMSILIASAPFASDQHVFEASIISVDARDGDTDARREYQAVLAGHYAEIRKGLYDIRALRGRRLRYAQMVFVGFLLAVIALGTSLLAERYLAGTSVTSIVGALAR